MLTENSETEQKFLERSTNTNSEIHNILCCLFLIQLVHSQTSLTLRTVLAMGQIIWFFA